MKAILFFLFIFLGFLLFIWPATAASARPLWWQVQSVDTMKYSRDLAREKLHDSSFLATIDTQVKNIAAAGATHVAVATPYDEEFLPFLTAWVKAARKYQLNVWFRGNWSGWEGWFKYSRISPSKHLALTKEFILSHPDLFLNGDIFSACPECENGGPGDPRKSGDVVGFRRFLIDLYRTTSAAFAEINKPVKSNFFSLNGDVAKLIMDRATTAALDGLVVVDHYVFSPDQLIADVKALAVSSQGQIILGEFGVPIPGIHGVMSQRQQAQWLDSALSQLVLTPEVIGINYWTSVGSSTSLWATAGSPKTAVSVLTSYFTPAFRPVTLKNSAGWPVSTAQASYLGRQFSADAQGIIRLPLMATDTSVIKFSASGYLDHGLQATTSTEPLTIVMTKTRENLFSKLLMLLHSLRRAILIGQ